jgi:hypothetical protein
LLRSNYASKKRIKRYLLALKNSRSNLLLNRPLARQSQVAQDSKQQLIFIVIFILSYLLAIAYSLRSKRPIYNSNNKNYIKIRTLPTKASAKYKKKSAGDNSCYLFGCFLLLLE